MTTTICALVCCVALSACSRSAPPPVRYALPSCPLTYQAIVAETTKMAGEPAEAPPMAMETEITFTAQPRAAFMELAAAVTTRINTGKVRSYALADAQYAPVHLTTDGAKWTEVGGPTFLYAAMGTQGGLAWFFPTLPAQGAVGSTATWEIPSFELAGAVVLTERARGKHPQMKDADASSPAKSRPTNATVTLKERTTEGGERVAIFTMTATTVADEASSLPAGPAMHVKATATYHGTYAVTAAGRVLRAQYEKHADAQLSYSAAGKESVQNHTIDSTGQLHLIAACDGPTAASLTPPLTREDRAVDVWGDAFVAIANGDREHALGAFSPELRRAHGDEKLWQALRTYQQRRGDMALAVPMLTSADAVQKVGDDITLTLDGSTPSVKRANTVSPVEVHVTLHETSGKIYVTVLRARLLLEATSLLEISPALLRVD